MDEQIEWSHPGRESLQLFYQISGGEITVSQLKVSGCLPFLETSKKWVSHLKGPIASRDPPMGTSHGDLIWQEVLLKIKKKWQSPVNQEELCHCRRVNTMTVDRAIVYGAHSVQAIRQQTSANTGCGTCHQMVVDLLEHRLGQSSSED